MILRMERGDLSSDEAQQLAKLLEHAQSGDFYALLGIKSSATEDEIKTAYYGISRTWHPDRHFRRDLGDYAEHLDFIFIQVNKAYKTLSDPTTRRRIDRQAQQSQEAQQLRKPKSERPRRAPARPKRTEPEKPAARTRRSTAEPSTADTQEERQARKQPKTSRGRAVRAMRKQMRGQSSRAKRYFEQGKADYEGGNPGKAVSSLHLACQFEPKNAEYVKLYRKVRSEARGLKSEACIQAAISAEQFQNYREAISQYQRAVELNPKDGMPFYRLALLVKRVEQDPRRALSYLRQAVGKSPETLEYRLELGELYVELGMGLNARREFQAVLKLDPANSRAKSGMKKT
jgi:tetratricopeptide (TPR) repeat protein